MTKKPSDIYHTLLNQHGDSAKAFGWGDERTRDIYAQVTLMVAKWQGQRCLEVGCGSGALYAYAQEKKLDLLYSGIDLTDSAIALAKQKHPEATFQCQDLFSLSYSESERPDYVLASGTFNAIPADTPSPQALLESAIEKMFLLSKKGISLTFKTRSDSAGSTLHLAAYDPVKVFQYARSLSDYAQINHSFSTQFCSLFIYK